MILFAILKKSLSVNYILRICAWAWIGNVAVHAHASIDTIKVSSLQEVTIKGSKVQSQLQGDGGMLQVKLHMLQPMPQLLGSTDPLRYTRMLPDVQTGNEYDAGLYVQGCDNSHNDVMLGGVPLYNVAHFLGIFSIFNTSHFSLMDFQKQATSGQNANRLGAHLNMVHYDSLVTRCHGDLSIGPLSSQGTLRMPLGKTSTLTLSGRIAYIDLLYKRWLVLEREQMKYGFADYNLTYLWHPSSRKKVWIDAYWGYDKAGIDVDHLTYKATFKWSNHMFALHYWYSNTHDLQFKHSVYLTRYQCDSGLERTDFLFRIPSGITDYGYRFHVENTEWSGGIHAIAHNIQPQSPIVTGTINNVADESREYHPFECSFYADKKCFFAEKWQLNIGIRSTLYHIEKRMMASLDPHMSVIYNANEKGLFTLHAGWKHQYLHRTGFTSVGLPTEFWMPSTTRYKPQSAFSISAQYDYYTSRKTYKLSLTAYCKWLRKQIEYVGTPIDVLTGHYNIEQNLLQGHGKNFGASLMIEKRTGKINGWITYSWGKALRRYPNSVYDGVYPANHEREHELNQVAVWHINSRLKVGQTLVFATGTPFTAPLKFYYLGGNLVSEFGRHNAQRLKPYFRVDLSIQYLLKRKGEAKHGLNFSLYNVTARHNELFRTLRIKRDGFSYRSVSLSMPLLPSVSYFYRF